MTIKKRKSPKQNAKVVSTEPPTKEAKKAPAESVFEMALRARNERAARPTVRVAKAPSRIRPTMRIKGWFWIHTALYGPIPIFHPKDEGGFSDEPLFIMPDVADELCTEGSLFENAIKEHMGYLAYTMGAPFFSFSFHSLIPRQGVIIPLLSRRLLPSRLAVTIGSVSTGMMTCVSSMT